MEFKKLKGYPEYEASEKGSVRRIANKAMVVKQKEGKLKDKYVLDGPDGKEHAISVEEAINLREDGATGQAEGDKGGKAKKEKKAGGIERGTKIKEILALHADGKSNKEIIEKGYHPTTVSIQVSKYKKKIAALLGEGKTEKEIVKIGYAEHSVKSVVEKLKAPKAEKKEKKADKE